VWKKTSHEAASFIDDLGADLASTLVNWFMAFEEEVCIDRSRTTQLKPSRPLRRGGLLSRKGFLSFLTACIFKRGFFREPAFALYGLDLR